MGEKGAVKPWLAGLALLCILAAEKVVAAPTTFESVIGGGLLCRDAIDPAYFRDYLIRFYAGPVRRESGADWFKPDPEQRLYDMVITDIFVSTDDSPYRFLGVVFREKIAAARKKMQEVADTKFMPFPSETVLRSAQGSFLVELDAGRSRLTCVKNREDQPLPDP